MLSFSSKAFAATTEIRAIIEPVRYIYLDNNDRVTKIQTNISLDKPALTFWINHNSKNINPNRKAIDQYDIFIKYIPKNKIGTFYASKKSINQLSFTAIFSRLSPIESTKIYQFNFLKNN
jgi:hypothetical protein